MINNIGKTSSIIRLTAGLTILTLYFTQILTGTIGTVLFSIAGLLLISGIFRTDPLKYMLQRIKNKE